MKRLLIAVILAAWPGAARAQEVVAVLSSDLSAYRETYESFLSAFGRPAPLLPMGEAPPAGAKVVVTFGGKAALQSYHAGVVLIYAIAPGLIVGRKTHDGPSVKIHMEPEADALLRALTEIQPKLKRLAVLWSSPSRAVFAERVAQAGAARGIAVTAERLEDVDDLPRRLRGLKGKIDAIWLPPDPLLLSARNFAIIKHFSYDNDIPFYAPTEGLAAQGATAAASVSYEEMGRIMAASVTDVLSGRDFSSEHQSAQVRVTLNRAAAAEAELSIPAEVFPAADKVVP